MAKDYYFERALFVVGEQNSGKSKQLRSMFLDVNLGKNGIIPDDSKLPDMYRGTRFANLSRFYRLSQNIGFNLYFVNSRKRRKSELRAKTNTGRWYPSLPNKNIASKTDNPE